MKDIDPVTNLPCLPKGYHVVILPAKVYNYCIKIIDDSNHEAVVTDFTDATSTRGIQRVVNRMRKQLLLTTRSDDRFGSYPPKKLGNS